MGNVRPTELVVRFLFSFSINITRVLYSYYSYYSEFRVYIRQSGVGFFSTALRARAGPARPNLGARCRLRSGSTSACIPGARLSIISLVAVS